ARSMTADYFDFGIVGGPRSASAMARSPKNRPPLQLGTGFMTLRELLSGLNVRSVTGDLDTQILGLAYDSRQVTAGNLCFAIRGIRSDGNRFVPDALAKGAAAIVSGTVRPRVLKPSAPWIHVDDEREAMASIAANFYGHPTRQLHLIGVTGTNGKTTTTY